MANNYSSSTRSAKNGALYIQKRFPCWLNVYGLGLVWKFEDWDV